MHFVNLLLLRQAYLHIQKTYSSEGLSREITVSLHAGLITGEHWKKYEAPQILKSETRAGQTGTRRPRRSSRRGWVEGPGRRCRRSRSGSGETQWRTCPGTSGRTWPAPTEREPHACAAAEPSERSLGSAVKAEIWAKCVEDFGQVGG